MWRYPLLTSWSLGPLVLPEHLPCISGQWIELPHLGTTCQSPEIIVTLFEQSINLFMYGEDVDVISRIFSHCVSIMETFYLFLLAIMKSSSPGFADSTPSLCQKASVYNFHTCTKMVLHLVEDGTLHALIFAPTIHLEYRIPTRDPYHRVSQ